MTCAECHHNGPTDEYHPFAFCVLWSAGLDPWSVIDEAVAAREDPE